MGLVARALSKRATLPPNGWAADNLNVGSNSLTGLASAAGVQVNEQKALGIATVYACSRLIASAVADTPLYARREVTVRGRKIKRRVPAGRAPLVEDPFLDVSPITGLFQMVSSLALRGNAYALIVERDELLYPTKLMTLHPDRCKPAKDPKDDRVKFLVGQQYIEPVDIFHVPLFTLPGSPFGLSPIDQHAQSLGLTLAAEEYGARFFGQGSVMSVVLKTPLNLDETQLRIMAQSWQAAHGGFRRSHMPAVASGGADVVPITVPNDAAQFLETRKFQRNEIAMMFGVPPHMIGDVEKTTSWGTGLQQQSIGFVRYTLRDYFSRIQEAFTRAMPPGILAEFDLSDLLRGDLAERYAAYQQGRTMTVLSPNDIRVMEGLEPVDDPLMDEYLLPLNSNVSASDVPELAAELPKPQPAPATAQPQPVEDTQP